MLMRAEARRFEMTAPRLTPFEVGKSVALPAPPSLPPSFDLDSSSYFIRRRLDVF